MEREFITTKKPVYRDEAEGDLLYDDGNTTVERTDDRMIVKVRVGKFQNWMQLADEFRCSVAMQSRWAMEHRKDDKEKIAELPAIVRDEVFEERRNEMRIDNSDPFLYVYFHSSYNWVIYEGETEYLFLYEMEIKDMYALAIPDQIEALYFWPKDDAGAITDFLRSWYYRVNGYPEDEEESC